MRVLITGAEGFIGKNLVFRLRELGGFEILSFDCHDALTALANKVNAADAIVHLAGVNRPKDESEFVEGNAHLTAQLCELVAATARPIPLIVSSSVQAELDNPYGRSKLAAERAATDLAKRTGNPVTIYRLANVFGKWCRPNYNSVVATFCHNMANDLPIQINDASAYLRLVYVDDVVNEFVAALHNTSVGVRFGEVAPVYETSLGELASRIESFKASRTSLACGRVGAGLARALYATYVSYLPPAKFAYEVAGHADERGVFVEMLKTEDSGQFSFFSARPGITRGGHYHHTKTEKFLVVKGAARFGFRNIVSNESYAIFTSADKPTIVDTIPGWTHDITNVGEDEMVVMLWANEVFDRSKPDTIACKV